MGTWRLILLAIVSVLPGLPFAINAGVIAQWSFDSNSITPSTGTGTLSLIGGISAAFVSGVSGTDVALNTSVYPAQFTGNKRAGVQCKVSTAGYKNICVLWYQRVSPTASKYARFQWSTNGTTYSDVPFTLSMLNANEFEVHGVEFLPGDWADNNPNFAFRIVTEFQSTALTNNNAYYVTASGQSYTTVGTVRFDLITIYGDQMAARLIPSSASGVFQTRVVGLFGSNYVLQSSDEPDFSATWLSLVTNTAPFTFTESATMAHRFYRAVLLP